MFGSTILEVAIGVVFVYLLLAVFCTALVEMYSRWKNLRAVYLKQGISELLRGLPDGVTKIYEHPLIANLARKGEKPSYITPRTFALALMDVVGDGYAGAGTHERFRAAITAPEPAALPAGALRMDKGFKAALQALAGDIKLTAEEAVENIAAWFDQAMDRVSGWYKRRIQIVTLIVAVIVTLVANADTFQMAARLWQDPAMRAAVVAQATERAKKAPRLTIEYPDAESPIPSEPVDTGAAAGTQAVTSADVAQLGELTGWSGDVRRLNGLIRRMQLDKDAATKKCLLALSASYTPCQTPPRQGEGQPSASDACCTWVAKELDIARQDAAWHWGDISRNLGTFFAWLGWLFSHRLAGWVMTAIAVSLGAPFWFEILNKLIKIRSTGDSPRDKDKAPTQQPKAPAPAKA